MRKLEIGKAMPPTWHGLRPCSPRCHAGSHETQVRGPNRTPAMRTAHKLFSLSLLALYLSFTPWFFVPRPPLPARLKPKWIRVEVQVESMFTPVELNARWKQDGPV